jgi:predicted outer membrane protein
MKTSTLVSAFALAASLSFGGAYAADGVEGGTQGNQGSQAVKGKLDDKAILDRISAQNKFEVEAGQLAVKASKNPQVQQYAQQKVHAHQSADKQAAQIAKDLGTKLEPDFKAADEDEASAKQALMRAKQGLQGVQSDSKRFDKEYTKVAVEVQQKSITKMGQYQQQAQSAQVKQLAKDLKDEAEIDLQQAQDLEDQVNE